MRRLSTRRRTEPLTGGVLLAVLGFSSLAWAGEDAVDVERFRPSTDPYGYALTEGAQVLGHLQVGVGMWGSYAEDAWVDGRRRRLPQLIHREEPGLFDQRSVADLQLGMGWGGRVALGLDLPVVLWQEAPTMADELLAFGPGDLRVTGKALLVQTQEVPFGMSLLGQVSTPTGLPESYMGEGEVRGLSMLAFELSDRPVATREYRVRGALNAGYRLRRRGVDRPLDMGDEVIFRGALSARPGPGAELGVESSLVIGQNDQRPLEVLPWVKLHPHRLVTITGGAGFGVLGGHGAPGTRVFMGATLAPSFDPALREPDPPDLFALDTDGDGVVDALDLCPYEAAPGTSGCPDLAAPPPERPEPPPPAPVTDTDGDGVPDHLDMCPFEPAVGRIDGCPDLIPEEPVEVERVVVERSRISIEDTIHFEVDRAEIKPESYGLLNEIAEVILEHPDLRSIRIEGHTDSQGGEAYNLRLSQNRAESVKDFLVQQGVERERLDAAGFGMSRPIDTNETAEGRARNRRVEFLIIDRD